MTTHFKNLKEANLASFDRKCVGNSASQNRNSVRFGNHLDASSFKYKVSWKLTKDSSEVLLGIFEVNLKGLTSEGYVSREGNDYRLVIYHESNGNIILKSKIGMPDHIIGYQSRSLMASVKVNNLKPSITSTWPEWDEIPNDVLKDIFTKTSQYIKLLNPSIVDAIVKDNEKNHDFFINILGENGIDPRIYMWPGSSCLFPGIRRFVGKYEKARTNVEKETRSTKQALYLDDNSFPVSAWSLLFRGKKSNNQGPNGYSLAHILPHKDYNKEQIGQELRILKDPPPFALSGLFSSLTNTAYCPTSVMKPTDFNLDIRLVLQNKMKSLYDGSCNVLPEWFAFQNRNSDCKWDISEFKWSETIGELTHIQSLLNFRLSWYREMEIKLL